MSAVLRDDLLSAEDHQILDDTRRACRDLIAKCDEVAAYITALRAKSKARWDEGNTDMAEFVADPLRAPLPGDPAAPHPVSDAATATPEVLVPVPDVDVPVTAATPGPVEDPVAVQAALLTEQLAGLRETITKIDERAAVSQKTAQDAAKSAASADTRSGKAFRWSRGTVAVLVFDILFTLTIGYLVHTNQATTDELQATTVQLTKVVAQVQAQQKIIDGQQHESSITRQKVLCPLYVLLLKTYSPAARDKYAQGPAAYDAAFATLRDATAVLQCQ